ncbi:MAG: putative HAD superfamily hydrolase [Candidatus Poriferisodalaceae bacterium]|jgi:predicted HAD superfamily hydrolase
MNSDPGVGLFDFSGYKVASFDVFDTVLERSQLRPSDLFHQVLDDPAAASLVAQERIRAELEARTRAADRGEEEVTYKEIHEVLSLRLEALGLPVRFEQLEFECERASVRPVASTAALIQLARDAGCLVVFASDTYFSETQLRELLDAAGVPFPDLILSSADELATKRTGRLFERLIERTGSRSIVHFGDDQHSDVENAVRLGLDAHHVPAARDITKRFTEAVDRHIPHSSAGDRFGDPRGAAEVFGAAASLLRAAGSVERSLGVEIFGPFVLGFAQFIDAASRDAGLDRLVFVTREGAILQQAYEAVAANPLPSTLLAASRRSWLLPLIVAPLTEDDLDLLTSGGHRRTIRESLSQAGLTFAPDVLDAVHAAGFESFDSMVGPGDVARLRSMFLQLSPQVAAVAEREASEVKRYLANQDLDGARLGLVDLGWHATLQIGFQRWLHRMDSDAEVVGLFAGTYDLRRTAWPLEQRSWLVHDGLPATRLPALRQMVNVLEMVVSSTHGSVLGFEGSVPILGESHPGALEINEIQVGVIDLVNRARRSRPIAPEAVMALLAAIAERPTLAEARALGGLPHAEGYGAASHSQLVQFPTDPLVGRVGLGRRLAETWWPAGYRVMLNDAPVALRRTIVERYLWSCRQVLRQEFPRLLSWGNRASSFARWLRAR